MSVVFVPKANYIQHGLQDIIRIIKESDVSEGAFPGLSEQQPTARFLDLFWFYDDSEKPSSHENRLDLVTFGINLNYGNIRINGYLDVREHLHNQALFITKDLMTVNAAIYPTGAFHIRHLKNGESYKPIEQLFVQYNPEKEAWHDELPTTLFIRHNDMMKMEIARNDERYYYIFKDRQFDLLYHALDFVLNDGFNLVGSKK